MLRLQNTILEMIAKGEAIKPTIDRLCREIERLIPDTLCSVLTVDADGRLHPLSASGLPDDYNLAIENLAIGPTAGSCGAAAYFGSPVVVTDIASDPLWQDYRQLALPLGLAACWSSPIRDGQGTVIATFALYFREKKGPTPHEQAIIDASVNLCAIAFERHHRVLERARLAYIDGLTGLPNRAAFTTTLSHLPSSKANTWGLLLIDLDNLKTVNDGFGHLAGDELIRAVAAKLSKAVHPNRAFRIGGDEFAVIISSGDAEAQLEPIGRAILHALDTPVQCGGNAIAPKASIGSSVIQYPYQATEAVRQEADLALYHAKETRRGGHIRFTADLGTAITRRLSSIQMLRDALNDGRVKAFYQPLVRIETGEVAGVEALCRIVQADGRVIPAAEFQDATADVHIATELTRQMIRQAASDVRGWIDSGVAFQRVSINVTSSDFDGGCLCEHLERAFNEAGVPLSHLTIEVTESVYAGQRDSAVMAQIEDMRARGMQIALDDFGTGLASLSTLLSMPVDVIKIDRSFTASLDSDEASAAIVEGLIGIARKLRIGIIAEGIETAEQAQILREYGCQFGQGYHYHRALNSESIYRLLLQRPDELRAEPAELKRRHA